MKISLKKHSKIYILTPAYTATGGVELLYQLAYKIKKVIGFDNVFIVYMGKKNRADKNPTNKAYEKYQARISDKIEDSEDNILIVPEIYTKEVYKYKNIRKVVWRLSTDNYYFHIDLIRSVYNYLILKIFNSQNYVGFNKDLLKINYHLVQSDYAKNHIIGKGIKKEYVAELGDYLNVDFLKNGDVNTLVKKGNIVAYNPKKGAKFTKRLINYMTLKGDNIEFIPIKNMSRSQVIELLKKSKAYIDFGHFPGKDRIPREASILGCVIMISKMGAGGYFKDFPLDDKFKVDDLKDVKTMREKLLYLVNNYKTVVGEFSTYNNYIKKEEEVFDRNVKNLFVKE